MQKIRAFLGVAISSSMRDELSEWQENIRRNLPSINWVRPDSIHLTLNFLGSIDPPRVDEISAALTPLVGQKKSFVCGVRGIGAFPNAHIPRVLWVGVAEGKADLQHLVLDLDEALELVGFSREGTAFRPHLTLARIKTDRENAGSTLRRLGVFQDARDFGTLSVDRITLFQSRNSRTGTVYETLSTMPLLGQDPGEGQRRTPT
jgi:RNA 2',3'-cyclic 3'-phosphodiesterase